ncbi:MAG TPA: hypothetical protein VG265_13390 [Gaiellaceae bacterium]|nr:hypothetical protein [Gaiellaceae bacterium]
MIALPNLTDRERNELRVARSRGQDPVAARRRIARQRRLREQERRQRRHAEPS